MVGWDVGHPLSFRSLMDGGCLWCVFCRAKGESCVYRHHPLPVGRVFPVVGGDTRQIVYKSRLALNIFEF